MLAKRIGKSKLNQNPSNNNTEMGSRFRWISFLDLVIPLEGSFSLSGEAWLLKFKSKHAWAPRSTASTVRFAEWSTEFKIQFA